MRVLVVDDERPLVETLRRGLTDEGFVVDVAHEGVSGLGLAEHGVYDVLVLDIMLPDSTAMRSSSGCVPARSGPRC